MSWKGKDTQLASDHTQEYSTAKLITKRKRQHGNKFSCYIFPRRSEACVLFLLHPLRPPGASFHYLLPHPLFPLSPSTNLGPEGKGEGREETREGIGVVGGKRLLSVAGKRKRCPAHNHVPFFLIPSPTPSPSPKGRKGGLG